MIKTFTVHSLSEYAEPAELITRLMDDFTVFILEGELGAGKTTLVQKICAFLESEDVASSPTFALINPYQTKKGMVYHMDMYRVKTPEEAIDFGLEEYIWEDQFCFIEWPGIIESLLPDNYVKISIDQKQDLVREIRIETLNTKD